MATTLTATPADAPAEHITPALSVRDFFQLMKPGVLLLVVFTAIIGMVLAPATVHPAIFFTIVFSIALGSGAAAMFNMWYDRDIDAIMKRTQGRPIIMGKIAAEDVLVYAVMLSMASVIMLGLVSNWIAAGLLAFSIFFYAYIYTHALKRRTPQNIVIGGAAGAFPPAIGWLAMSGGDMSLFPWLMFAIIFIWTPPHFWALAVYRHDDYKKANVPMLPVTHGISCTKRNIMGYSIALLLTSLTPTLFGYSGMLYFCVAAALGLQFCRLAFRTLRADDPKVAMRLFGYSILYLFVLFGALLLDHVILRAF